MGIDIGGERPTQQAIYTSLDDKKMLMKGSSRRKEIEASRVGVDQNIGRQRLMTKLNHQRECEVLTPTNQSRRNLIKIKCSATTVRNMDILLMNFCIRNKERSINELMKMHT